MLEVYSNNVIVVADEPIPLNNVALYKGTSAQLLGASTIQFNKCGVYEVTVSFSATATTAGDISVQLRKNGILQPQAISTITAADATSIHSSSFTTLVQVSENNSPCCACSTPTRVEIVNVGVGATLNNIDVTVVRI